MTHYSESDVNKLKRLVAEGVQVKEEVKTLNEGLRDTVKAIAEELGITPAVLNKVIAIAHKADFDKNREEFEELECILQSVGRAQ